MHATDEVIYNGKRIFKHQFRAFIYGVEGQSKLVNSWDEYEANLSSGVWFASIDAIPKAKPQRKKPVKVEESEGFKSIEDHIFPEQEGE